MINLDKSGWLHFNSENPLEFNFLSGRLFQSHILTLLLEFAIKLWYELSVDQPKVCYLFIYFFFGYNMTSHNLIVFKSVVWKKGDELEFPKNAILGLGVGSNPGPLAPKACALRMRHSTSTQCYQCREQNVFLWDNVWNVPYPIQRLTFPVEKGPGASVIKL